MTRIVAIEHLTLDGVFQAPARADEDTRNGFEHGGWGIPGSDPKMQEVIGRAMAGGWSLLAGRTTYEDLHEGWAVRQPANPMTRALTGAQKFVASHDAAYQARWENSTLLTGDTAEAVRELKQGHDKTLVMFGSGKLLRALMRHGLVDELVLMVHPLVLGAGSRLFEPGQGPSTLKLSGQIATATGVAILTYAFDGKVAA
ncbi:dihydrofolate reductase family protein [Mesorhizobium sp. CA8]|uniref:dihydrofolate reductase family protein n=1 Tax=unclassified Mesorhizobium TaxID=325217 RepID=UPI001CCD7037|nr:MULTISPECIES: dihydrofolate reductase family protein [unclassified Mesorhizobium]MBZ9761550.1 dihydrofolate reductase family protein [Mesorhizobium sp. CA8]MBZ9821380.1 dihydrofolate reductase family protein [Mesorhizobium sp. CA4]